MYLPQREWNLKGGIFYATGKDSQYELYVVRQFEDETSLEKMIPVASGKLGNAGYYTVDFNQGIEVDAGSVMRLFCI